MQGGRRTAREHHALERCIAGDQRAAAGLRRGPDRPSTGGDERRSDQGLKWSRTGASEGGGCRRVLSSGDPNQCLDSDGAVGQQSGLQCSAEEHRVPGTAERQG